jgi:SNF2 family DNA or RNA helicase
MNDFTSETTIYEIKGKLKLPKPLRSYQWEGVSFLVNNSSCLLADEMGLGKTVQVSVALEIMYHQNQLNRALIIVPSSLKYNWQNELTKWTNSPSIQRVQGSTKDREAYYRLPINILIASFEEIRMDALSLLNKIDFDIVVIDEAQRIKNPNSITSLMCKIIRRKRSWALSGTPLENEKRDFVSIFNFVKKGLIHEALSNPEIHNRIKPNFLRRKKSEVAKELPPIIEQEIPIVLEGFQREAYENVLFEKLARNRPYSYGELLAIITKLKQICNYDPLSGESSKFEILNGIIEEHNISGKKLIIFSQYVDTLKWISNKISYIPHDIYYGELDQEAREKVIENFRHNNLLNILLISLMAGGVGLNIQEAQTVVLFDRWWNPAIEEQAIQRAHRIGRESPLHVVKFLVISSIEERISQIVLGKRIIFNDVIESAENAYVPRFSINTLRSMLGISEANKEIENGENN